MSAFLRTASRAAAVRTTARTFSSTTPRPIAKVTIIGNLADTPELKATSTGREILKFSVASNSGPQDNRHTSWFNVTSFVDGPRREFLQSLSKGTLVFVEGDISINTWEDAEGKSRSGVNVVHRNLEVLRRPQDRSDE
ncbi:hypothetical protein B0H67DRAFT_491610 [Lasiosphaeris hirsuta]|uniref:SsDNA binding protein n=1 Tax=Lasiosphaeris hirsuta TaxID=260670 RepID=A0AA40A8A1_9PEZI|nr:hypothetical protein B0H67DRAFT_491610 [Lasiosphaeris hirsuta]